MIALSKNNVVVIFLLKIVNFYDTLKLTRGESNGNYRNDQISFK